MKVAVAGKGGVGKTTLVALLALEAVRQGYKVFAVDADPAATLGLTVGFPEAPAPLAEYAELIAGRAGQGGFVKLNPRVDDIPDQYSVEKAGVRLLVLGGVRKGGGGCACPENTFLRALLRHLFLHRDEVVLVDMEAGIEHLGRGTAEAVDALLVVVEPDVRSTSVAERIFLLGQEVGVRRWGAVANKVRSAEELALVRGWLPEGLPLVGELPFLQELAQPAKGHSLPPGPVPAIVRILGWLRGPEA